MTADISKAFLRIGLNESDRDVCRILLKSPVRGSQLETWRLCKVGFGIVSSPFLLNATLRHHFKKYDTNTAAALRRNLYVDDFVQSADGETQAIDYAVEAREILLAGGFSLQKFNSSSEAVRSALSEKDYDVCQDRESKVLGVSWNCLLYTSPSPRDLSTSRMPSSA